MPIRQRLSTTDDGRAVVIKQANGDADVERLVREVALLRLAAHPGVVEVLADRSLPGGVHEVMLAMAGTRTVGDLRLPLAGTAGLIAALATVVADLHEIGIAHGRIQADHVVIDAGGRPILCGFGEAVRIEAVRIDAVRIDADPPSVARAVDVAGLGVLLRTLVRADEDPTDGWSPIPERRFRGADRWAAHTRRALLNVADHATADDLLSRPSATALATAVLAALPEARLPGAAGGTEEADLPPPTVPWPRRRFAALREAGSALFRRRPPLVSVAGAVGVGLLVFGVAGLLRPATTEPSPLGSGASDASDAGDRSEVQDGPDGPDGPDVSVVPASGPPTSCPDAPDPTSVVAGSVLADHDGDGCPSALLLGDGVVTVGGVRYVVGAPGDLLAIGDWDCDGRATVALVERPSGLTYLFDSWATEGAEVVVRPVATIAEADGAVPLDDDGDGCPVLVVTDATGDRTEVTP